MRSYKFPKMFNSNSSNIWKSEDYNKATKQNTFLLLQSERGELKCDPYFGVTLKHFLFEQNNYVLREALIDAIYTQLALFIPQLRVRRQDIAIEPTAEKGKLVCKFKGISQVDYQLTTYKLTLFDNIEIY